MQEYDTPIPANAEIYIIEFTNMIEFKILNPDGFINAFIDDSFSLKEWIMGKIENKVSKD